MSFTHFDNKGNAIMVDVSDKQESMREAIAKSKIFMENDTIKKIKNGDVCKGDVLSVARIAGIMASKQTSNLIPMCHPLLISKSEINFEIFYDYIEITAIVKIFGKTGVEMEALMSASVAALTIYDMCKALDKHMIIQDTHLFKKTGGKSGEFNFYLP